MTSKRAMTPEELEQLLGAAESRDDFEIPTVLELDEAMRDLYKVDLINAWAFRRRLRWAIKSCNKKLSKRWRIK